jgi:hypothetical protein
LHSFARRVLDYRVRRTYADSDGRYADRAPRPRVLVAADDAGHLDLAALAQKVEAFSLQQRGRLQLYCHSAGDQCVAEVDADMDSADDAAAIGIRALLLAYAIEYVLVRQWAPSTVRRGRRVWHPCDPTLLTLHWRRPSCSIAAIGAPSIRHSPTRGSPLAMRFRTRGLVSGHPQLSPA